MHEVSLCEGVVGLIEDEAARQRFRRVKSIVLEIGELSHVEGQAMEFCFDAVSHGTVAEGARLDIVTVAGVGWCPDCQASLPMIERYGACPRCGGSRLRITAGDELRVLEMEVE